MVVNKKGQAIFFTLMLGIVVAILALAFAPVVKEFVDDARNSTSDTQVGLNCNNLSASNATYNQDFDKANCAAVDLATPYFFFGLLALVIIIIGAKLYIGGAA